MISRDLTAVSFPSVTAEPADSGKDKEAGPTTPEIGEGVSSNKLVSLLVRLVKSSRV